MITTEHLLRCGIYTSTDIFTSLYDHTKRFTCGEHLLRCGIDTSTYIVFIIIICILYYSTNSLSLTIAHPRNRTTAQFPQGLGSPPNSLLRLRETPYTTLLVFPALYPRHDFSVTQKGRVSPPTRKGLTLLPGLVRRPQHLPLGLQPRSPECSTHTSLSIRR